MNQSDDFRELWNEYGKRLDQSLRMNESLLARGNLTSAERSLQPLMRGIVIEIVADAIALLLIGSFVADSMALPRYAVVGGVLFVGAWLALILSVRQLVLLTKIDFDEPVLAIQTSLERLRAERVHTTYWTIVASPLLWVVLVVLALHAIGVDPFADASRYLLANLLFAAVVIGCGITWARRTGVHRSRLGDLLAGRSLAEARARLDTLLRYAD